MAVKMDSYDDVYRRALELDCNVPTGLALLPRNFQTAGSKDDLIHEDSTLTVRSLWRQAGVVETRIEKEDDHFPYIREHAVDWIGPTVFVSASLLSQNPNAVAVALGIVSNYLTDVFKGAVRNPTVRLSIVKEHLSQQETERKYTRIQYEGDIRGLSQLPDIIREVENDG